MSAKSKKPKKRSKIALGMILNTKGGPMRHRANRRAKEREAAEDKGEQDLDTEDEDDYLYLVEKSFDDADSQ